jgi:predicted ATPase
VVYEGLPRHRRLYLHGQVGLALERSLRAKAGAVELAWHFEQARQLDAGLTGKATTYLLQAGRQAERQSANQEALSYYQRGLDILHSLPETPQRQQQTLELQIALTVPTTVVHGYASSETRDVYDRVSELARKLGDTPALLTALAGLSRYYGVSGDIKTGMEVGEQIFAIAQTTQETAALLQACRIMGSTLFALGRPKEARAFWERGAALYEPAEHERLAYRFGHDPAAIFHGYLIQTLWLLGYPDQAATQGERLRDLVRSFSHPTSLAYAHCFLAMSACLLRNARSASHDAEEAIRLGQSYGLPSWTALATAMRGWALVEQGEAVEGLVQLSEGITAWRARGFRHLAPFLLALQAESCLKAHRLEEGTAALAAARTIAQNGGDTYWMAEVDRLQGELLKTQGEDDREVEAHFRQALEISRQQAARMLELRAAMSLARLWQSHDKNQAAREMLAEVYDQFDEGFGSHDVQAANALLQSLS